MYFVRYVLFSLWVILKAQYGPNKVPETKGVTLEEMEEVFGVTGQNLAVEDQQRLDAIHRKIGLITDDPKGDERVSDEKA